jgi:ribulose-phosphate 3-epimerase
VVLNPATPLCTIENILGDVDMVLLMTVNPGFGGQNFIRGMLPKIRRLRRMIDEQEHPVLLEVDGGVNKGSVDELVAAGVDVFVAGSAVFCGKGKADYAVNVKELKNRMGNPPK